MLSPIANYRHLRKLGIGRLDALKILLSAARARRRVRRSIRLGARAAVEGQRP